MTCDCGEVAAYEDRGRLLCFECAAPYNSAPKACPICIAKGRDWCSSPRHHGRLVRAKEDRLPELRPTSPAAIILSTNP